MTDRPDNPRRASLARVVMFVAWVAVAAVGCGHPYYEVWVDNRTDATYHLYVGFESGSAVDGESVYYSNAITPNAKGLAHGGYNDQPDTWALVTDCVLVAQGQIRDADTGLVVDAAGVDVLRGERLSGDPPVAEFPKLVPDEWCPEFGGDF